MLLGSAKRLSRGRSFPHAARLPGLHVFENFVSPEQEGPLLRAIERAAPPWSLSKWNGVKMLKEWGTRIVFDNGVAAIDDASQSSPLPDFLQALAARFTGGDYLPCAAFRPNNCNAITYLPKKGHSLEPHFDDRRLSGELLANISLVSDASMRYVLPDTGEEIDVLLKRGSLQVVTGEARYRWKHSIPPENFTGVRRVSLTFRHQGGGAGSVAVSSSKTSWSDSLKAPSLS